MKKTFKHFFCLFVAILCFGQMWATDYTIYQATSSGVDCSNATKTGVSVTFNSMKGISNSPITSVANTTYGIEAGLKAPRWGGSGDGKNIAIVVAENYTATITAYVQVNTASQTVTIKQTTESGDNVASVSCSAIETVYQVQATDLAAGTYYIKANDKVGLIKLVASVTATGGGGEEPGDDPDPDTPIAGTIEDLVTIDGEFSFEPTATLANNTLYEGKKIISLGENPYKNNGVQIKSSRQLAFKVAAGAKIAVTFNENGTRAMQIGTSSAGTDLASSATSPVTANRTTAGIVYISASSDLYLTKLEISYPTFYTITYNYNGGTLKDGESDITESAKETGETFTVASASVLDAPDGKEFDKWNDGSADYAQGATYTVGTANVTLTAQWRNETTKYAVTYDLGDYTAGVAPTETDKSEGSVFAIKAAPEWTDHDFLGWKCNIDNNTYQATNNYIMTAAATTFTAQWQAFFTITYKDGETVLGTEKVNAGDSPVGIADPVKGLYSFVGWTLEGEDDLIDPTTLDASTTLFAKWVDFDGCAYLAPETSGDALTVGASVDLKSASFGGSVKVAGLSGSGKIAYNAAGLAFTGGGGDSIRVTLNNQMQVGTKISVYLQAGGTGSRGLKLQTLAKANVATLGWSSATQGAVETFTYTVAANEGLVGEKAFLLARNNTVYLKYITVEECAPQDFTVTYKDGASTMGTEYVIENEHPTASGIATRKNGYVFEGWAETDGGSVVDLDDITITADKTFYAVYTERTLTSVTLEDMNLKVGDTGTPAMTLNPEGALVTSEVWAITASTATGTTIDENTGEITAGETAGQLTGQVTINGDKVASCTVTVVPGYESVQPVSETTTWQWEGILDANTNIAGTDTVLANYYGGAQWEKIAGKQGDYAYRAESHNCYQGTYLYFKATIPGILTIYARYASACALNVNGSKVADLTNSYQTYYAVVPAGDVFITSTAAMRIKSMKFDTDMQSYVSTGNAWGYDRTIKAGNYGTICLPKAGVMTGASIFEIAYYDEAQTKIFFDEVVNGYMVAGRPYIFLPNEGVNEIAVYSTDNANAAAGNWRGLYGFFDTSEDDAIKKLEENDYFLYNNQYYVVDHAAVGLVAVGNYRAYIKLNKVSGNPSTPAPGRRRVSMNVNGKQVATDVENVTNANVPQKVLINGRMFIMLDEKMYDVTGQIVK